ncbi:VUT family protein [Amycolatopsis sp. NPDC059021]|uniref:VUT family protein n=1 Tax=Amycolatopsis sp. NPDC059021 TaxID=3346704 RepID=UPI0036723808
MTALTTAAPTPAPTDDRQARRAAHWGAPVGGAIAAAGYLASVVAANWAGTQLLTVGCLAIPLGSCVAGMAFTARDVLHEAFGAVGVAVAITAGTVASIAVASPRIACASAAAFLLSELTDSWLYHRLRSRGPTVAVASSNLGGLLADSALFVPCAFGSLTLLPGQLAGKALATVAAVGITAAVSRCREGQW